jgi:hypothetical protein
VASTVRKDGNDGNDGGLRLANNELNNESDRLFWERGVNIGVFERCITRMKST